MNQKYDILPQALGPGGTYIILIQIVQHGGPHETADLGGIVKG